VTQQLPLPLLTDEYELAMADSYLAQGMAGMHAAFELSVRRLPPQRGYLIAAGLERAVDYLSRLRFDEDALSYLQGRQICSDALIDHLRTLRFTGALDAIAEGVAVFSGEPLLRVEGDLITCQIAETYLLNQVTYSTMVATKAARITDAAAGRPVVDFGLRRAHGADAGLLAARSAYIGGLAATATVEAGRLWGIPTTGTMAHSYVLAFPSELDAFCAFLTDHPDRSTLVIDTHDALSGARNAVAAAGLTGITPEAVRIDSGDLEQLSMSVRLILDGAGLTQTTIVCSGDLDEYRIDELIAAGAPIDGFGVGTSLATSSDAPTLGGVYKLVELDGRPVMKTSRGKVTLPGRHQVFRQAEGDVIALADEPLAGEPLLQPVMRNGEITGEAPSLTEIRDRARAEVEGLPLAVRALTQPVVVEPRLSPQLEALEEKIVEPA
jgi:nicotinate phosphoribosyltransferase